MSSLLRLAIAALVTLVLGGVVTLAVIGPRQLLAWGGYAAADSRLVTGLLVTGTPSQPVVYVTSSDPRIGSGLSEQDLPLDTNAGVISRLSRSEDGDGWTRSELVRGLPRSEENHATNGLALDERSRTLYVAQGGMTNRGAPSARFAFTPEYRLSGTILEVDLDRLTQTYDLPTRNDPTRDGVRDDGDPFGGNHGRNDAVTEPGGPVQILATGLRNPYDLVHTAAGHLFTIDNGPAFFWGGEPNPDGCGSTRPQEPGSYGPDVLHLIERGYDGGHPNPARNQCEYGRDGPGRGLATFGTSTNGLAEYRAANFGGRLQGDLLAASIDGRIYRVDLDADGTRVRSASPLLEADGFPLDLVAQGSADLFAGTVWAADWATGDLIVYEPVDRESGPHTRRLASSGIERQEVSYVRLGSRFYLAGGSTEHEIYDPRTDSWSNAAPLPDRLDHLQGVALDDQIYYLGGLRGFPEPHSNTVYVYDPATDSFSHGAPMPRPRGAGGVAAYDGKLYYAGGLHDGEAVSWLDVYDPRTNRWTQLPDMPRARDHFQAAVVGERLYALGGRNTAVDDFVTESDAFDLRRGRWVTGLAPIPTPRGGYGATVLEGEIVVMGGETSERALAAVEAYDPRTDRWRVLEPMAVPRHGIQVVECGGALYVAAGGTAPYGDDPSNLHTAFVTGSGGGCGVDHVGEPAGEIAFERRTVAAGLVNPTSHQFGPDGRLYVSEQDGSIQVLTVHRTLDGRYEILDRESIELIRRIPNHQDDGSSATSWRALFRAVGEAVGLCCSFPRHVAPSRAGGPVGPPSAQRGEQMFVEAGCAGCHSLERAGSEAYSGPPLDHLADVDPAYVRMAIIDPNSAIVKGYPPERMPDDYGRALTSQELTDLIEFLTRK